MSLSKILPETELLLRIKEASNKFNHLGNLIFFMNQQTYGKIYKRIKASFIFDVINYISYWSQIYQEDTNEERKEYSLEKLGIINECILSSEYEIQYIYNHEIKFIQDHFREINL